MLVLLLAAAYFVVAFTQQAMRARELRADIAEHQSALTKLRAENDALQDQTNLYATDAYFTYVEQRARRDLLLANADETLVLVNWVGTTPATIKPAPSAQPDEPNWKRWIEVFDQR